MADNVGILTGSDATVAADDIGGVLHQRVKISQGADGSATDVSSAAPLNVTLANTGANATAVKVDASSVAVPVTDNSGSLTVDNAALSVTGGGVEASALRVTLASDSTGVVSVDDNGGTLSVDDGGSTLTVDGTVAATQSGTWNVGTVTTITNVVHVDDNSSMLSIDDGGGAITVDNGGTFATQATLQAGTNTIGKVYSAPQTTKALTSASVSISSSGDNTVVSGTASQTIRVFKLVLVAASAVSITIKNGTGGTALTGAIPLTANGSFTMDCQDGEPGFVSASGGNFVVNLSGAVTVTGFVQYTKS